MEGILDSSGKGQDDFFYFRNHINSYDIPVDVSSQEDLMIFIYWQLLIGYIII